MMGMLEIPPLPPETISVEQLGDLLRQTGAAIEPVRREHAAMLAAAEARPRPIKQPT